MCLALPCGPPRLCPGVRSLSPWRPLLPLLLLLAGAFSSVSRTALPLCTLGSFLDESCRACGDGAGAGRSAGVSA